MAKTHDEPSSTTPADAPTLRPWCEHCSRIIADDDVVRGVDGVPVCRTCGEPVEYEEEDDGSHRAPWHFKLLLAGTVGYLIYRLIWFIQWLQHH